MKRAIIFTFLACIITILVSSCTTFYVASTNVSQDIYADNLGNEIAMNVPVGTVLLIKGKANNRGLARVRYHSDKTWYYIPSSNLTLVPGFNPKSYDYTYSTYEKSKTITNSGYDATIQTGPRGGKYYINKNGKKTYVKRSTPSGSTKRVGGKGSRGGRH